MREKVLSSIFTPKILYGYDHATPMLLWDVELIPSDALKATGATSRTGTVTGYSGTKRKRWLLCDVHLV